jgi:hypothetical protein
MVRCRFVASVFTRVSTPLGGLEIKAVVYKCEWPSRLQTTYGVLTIAPERGGSIVI